MPVSYPSKEGTTWIFLRRSTELVRAAIAYTGGTQDMKRLPMESTIAHTRRQTRAFSISMASVTHHRHRHISLRDNTIMLFFLSKNTGRKETECNCILSVFNSHNASRANNRNCNDLLNVVQSMHNCKHLIEHQITTNPF